MAKQRTVGNMIAPWRFLLFLAVGAAAVPIAYRFLGTEPLTAMAAFDAGAIAFLLVCLPLLWIKDPKIIETHAAQNDANRPILLALTGMVMVVLLLAIAAETVGHPPQPFTRILIIVTLAVAWLFSNTIYALHYAHLAYIDEEHCSGITFPGTVEPNYLDFVYFAFTLGMTFQTSDVTISSQHIRKIVTMHCLAAFVFNIGVLAFTINVLGSG
jgi:uncharacterized membrane protein